MGPLGAVAFDGDTLFVGSRLGRYAAYRDRLLWERQAGAPLSMPPVAFAKTIIYGTQAGSLFAVDERDGSERWRHALGGQLLRKPVVAQGRLIVGNSYDQLAALDAQTGKRLWLYSHEMRPGVALHGSVAAAVDGSTVFAGFTDGTVCALELQDGSIKWSRPISLERRELPDAVVAPVVAGGRVYAASQSDGVFALATDDGRVLWNQRTPRIVRMEWGERLFAFSGDGEAYALDASTGEVRWHTSMRVGQPTQPVLADGRITVGAWPGGLVVLDAETGSITQRLFVGGVASELAAAGDALAFVNEDNRLYLLRRPRS